MRFLNMSSLISGVVSRMLPQPTPDKMEETLRMGRYGESYALNLFNNDFGLADEGGYFTAINPTVGTGLATIAALTSLVDTSPFILVKNNDAPGGRRTYIRYIRLRCTAAGTGGTAINFAVKIDPGQPARYTSGGTVLLGPGAGVGVGGNVNADASNNPISIVYAGALVAAAASQSVRQLCGFQLRSVIPVVGDIYQFNFGCPEMFMLNTTITGTAIAYLAFGLPPAVIGPGGVFCFHIWLPSQSAASSYEVELGLVER